MKTRTNRIECANVLRRGAGLASVLALSSAASADWTVVNGYASLADSTISAVTGGQLILNDLEGAGTSLGLAIAGGQTAAGASVAQDGAAGQSLSIGLNDSFLFATTLSISSEILGAAPTRFGFVVTAAEIESGDPPAPADLPLTITVYYTDGTSSTHLHDVRSLATSSADDVFLGLNSDKGIDSVSISSVGAFSIDHVQYDAPASLAWAQVDPYSSAADGPFGANGDTISVQTLEGSLDGTGLAIEGASISEGDSVESDGATGKSLAVGSFVPFSAPAATLRLDPAVLGGAPTQFGFVVTAAVADDLFGQPAALPILITAFRADGTAVTATHEIKSMSGNTADDVFVGVIVPEGIDSVQVSSVVPFRIDHIQFDAAPALVPDFVKDDLDLDGKSDIFWQLPATSRAAVWKMDGLVRAGTTGTLPEVATGSSALAVGDLDGDRAADMLWRKRSNGELSGWLMSPTGVGSRGPLSETLGKEWKFLGMNDLDGDRRADILFMNATTRVLRLWTMNGLTVEGSADIGTLGAGLTFVGLGDLTADGKADIVFRSVTGEVRAWIMDGSTVVVDSVLQDSAARKATTWYAAGIADLDGDRKADILWQHRTQGRVDVWLMDGARVLSMGNAQPAVRSAWRVVGTPDLNGDGNRDLLLRNPATNQINGCLMDGRNAIEGGFIRRTTAVWKNVK